VVVANQRAEGQTFIGFWADRDLVAKIDEARGNNYPRSQFVRDSVAEYLRKRGYPVPDFQKSAPDRTGKGGPRPTIIYGEMKSGNSSLNEGSNSSKIQDYVDAIEESAAQKLRRKKKPSA